MASKSYLNDQKFFKPDYYKAIEYIIPKYLLNEEDEKFGKQIDIKDQIINSHISFADNIQATLNISAVAGTAFSGINSLSGIAPYFVKQNNLTKISPESFELYILDRVNKSYKQFYTEENFKAYLSGTLLPSIQLNKPTSYFTLGEAASSVHNYLIQNLSWLYFLNTSGPTYSTSGFVCNLLAEKLFNGKTIYLNDCLKGLSEYIWQNDFTDYIPDEFIQSTGKYTSGTQQLDKLKTWIDIVYSPLYSDRSDLTVNDRFEMAIDNGILEESKVIDGPFNKLIRLLSFGAYDVNDDSERLKSFYSIEECPDNLLPLLAELIGWKLFGSNPDRWRLQLRNAIEVYKKAGTKKSLQFALNTIFPKNIFYIEPVIQELWESYIPYLIFYSLATESPYFQSNQTWTRSLAESMQVEGYFENDLAENIKLVVDRIIYEIFLEFPEKFNIPNVGNEFNYRGRVYNIPPFEEYPYYANVELTNDMLNFIIGRLLCFGVNREFSNKLRDYIYDNSLAVDDLPRASSWLFFTSGYNEAPNVGDFLLNNDSNKFDYASLWSGKSSHFTLILDASEFDFSKKETTYDSADAIVLASKVVNEFAPAKAIPIIALSLSAIDSVESDSNNLPIVKFDPTDFGQSNYEISALYVSSYKRNTGKGNVIPFGPQTNLQDPLLRNAVAISSVPRNSFRRRNYEKIMPMNGFYDRTGFNMPVSFDPSASLSGIFLGFIPSSLTYKSISDYGNLPEVYSTCLNSSSVVYGYTVSNTVRCRGHLNLGYKDYYTDRGQLNDIFNTIHVIGERKKYYEASTTIGYSPDFVLGREVYRSLANTNTSVSAFPNNIKDYYNFKFGRDMHLLYKIYCNEFSRHSLRDQTLEQDGPNIFSHVYGPIFYNHDFDYVSNKDYVASSLSSTSQINSLNSISIPNVQIANNASSLYFSPSSNDIIISSIINNIDLILVSGASDQNSFTVVRVPGSERPYSVSEYMFNRTFLKAKSVDQFTRLRLDVRRLINDPYQANSQNFLLPEHDYKFNLDGLVCSNDGLSLGGRTIGVWVHTKNERGKVWSYSKDNVWERHDGILDMQDVMDRFMFMYTFPLGSKQPIDTTTVSSQTVGGCLEIITQTGGIVSPLLTLDKQDMSTFEVNFNTRNMDLVSDSIYFSSYGNVHRKNQEYVIDIFFLPDQQNGQNNFFLIDKVSMIDMTLNKMSTIPIINENSCDESRIETLKPELKSVFKFWNDISGKNAYTGYASRDSVESSGVMLDQGGSRLDYRLNSAWCNKTYTSKILTELQVPV